MNPQIASAVKPSKKVAEIYEMLGELVILEQQYNNILRIQNCLPKWNYGSTTTGSGKHAKTIHKLRHPTKKVARSDKTRRIEEQTTKLYVRLFNLRGAVKSKVEKLKTKDQIVLNGLLGGEQVRVD